MNEANPARKNLQGNLRQSEKDVRQNPERLDLEHMRQLILSHLSFRDLFQELYPDKYRRNSASLCPFGKSEEPCFHVQEEDGACHVEKCWCPTPDYGREWNVISLWMKCRSCDEERAIQELSKRLPANVFEQKSSTTEDGENRMAQQTIAQNGQCQAYSTAPISVKKTVNQWKGMSAKELLAKDIPPTKWIVSGLLPPGLTMLVGDSKIGKSFLALDLWYCVAAGEPVLGHYECEPCETLYIALEDGERRVQQRL